MITREHLREYVFLADGVTVDEFNWQDGEVTAVRSSLAQALVDSGLAKRDGYPLRPQTLLVFGGLSDFLVHASKEDKDLLLEHAREN